MSIENEVSRLPYKVGQDAEVRQERTTGRKVLWRQALLGTRQPARSREKIFARSAKRSKKMEMA